MTNEIINIEKELTPIKTEVISLKEKADALVILNDDDYNHATEFAGFVNDKSKSIEKMRKFFVDPLNAQVKSINAMFNPEIDEADAIVKIVKGKMGTYFQKKEEERLKEEKRLQDIRDKANAKREEKGIEPIAEPVKQVSEVARTVTTGTKQSTVKKVWKHEIESIDKLPDDVKKAIFAEAYNKGIISTVVQKFVNAGIREMSGVRIYEDVQIALK